jgi:hypothetical protein
MVGKPPHVRERERDLLRGSEKSVESAIDHLLELLGTKPVTGGVRIDRFSTVRRTRCYRKRGGTRCGGSIRCNRCGEPGHMGTQQSPGIPDRRVVFPGIPVTLWIEVKGRGGRLRKDQEAWLADNIAAGECAGPAWCVDDVRYMLQAAGFPARHLDGGLEQGRHIVSQTTIDYVKTWWWPE